MLQELNVEYFVCDAELTHLPYNRGSSVGIVTGLRAGLNPGSGKTFLCPSKRQDLLWGPPSVHYEMRNVDCIPGVRRPKRQADFFS